MVCFNPRFLSSAVTRKINLQLVHGRGKDLYCSGNELICYAYIVGVHGDTLWKLNTFILVEIKKILFFILTFLRCFHGLFLFVNKLICHDILPPSRRGSHVK